MQSQDKEASSCRTPPACSLAVCSTKAHKCRPDTEGIFMRYHANLACSREASSANRNQRFRVTFLAPANITKLETITLIKAFRMFLRVPAQVNYVRL